MSRREWTPAQIAALVFGVWWMSNGIVALTVGDSSRQPRSDDEHVDFRIRSSAGCHVRTVARP